MNVFESPFKLEGGKNAIREKVCYFWTVNEVGKHD
jgi:hypothetical protein